MFFHSLRCTGAALYFGAAIGIGRCFLRFYASLQSSFPPHKSSVFLNWFAASPEVVLPANL
jgi:hypothetical protein